MTNEELTAIYNEANALDPKRHNPITTERIFAAMREAAAREREACAKLCEARETEVIETACPSAAPGWWPDQVLHRCAGAIRMRSNVDVTGPRLRGSGGQQGSASQEPYSGD